jgi:hypothetical protein
LHTFSSYCPISQQFTESPYTSSDCLVKGDKICDTPADYNALYLLNNPACVPPYPLNDYNPDKTNIMSYWLNKTKFTNGQGVRMSDAITNAPYLQSVRSHLCSQIVASSRLCGNITINYKVSNSSYNTYQWSVTGNLQIVGASTNNNVNVKQLSTSTNSGGTIKVVLNSRIVMSKGIRIGCVSYSYGKPAGIYDWVSTNYENMGVVIPVDTNEAPINSFIWEITEANPNSLKVGDKPYFIGSNEESPNVFNSVTNQATINWGSISQSYLITCNGVDEDGELVLLSKNIVDVGDPKNNPCFKNNFQQIIAPNPVRDGRINILINKPEQINPCNYKEYDENYFFNSELDRINNSVTIFDYNGNQVYSGVFETNEFTIEDANLVSGNHYVVNLFTNESGFSQKVIIVE